MEPQPMQSPTSSSDVAGQILKNAPRARESARLLTIDEFRRQYFTPNARPTRARVRSWIVAGTRDGVFLPGFVLEGRYFVDADKLDTFFDSCAKRTSEDAAKKTAGRRSTKARAAAALAALRKNYGF